MGAGALECAQYAAGIVTDGVVVRTAHALVSYRPASAISGKLALACLACYRCALS